MREVWKCENGDIFPVLDYQEFAKRATAIAGTTWRMRGIGVPMVPVDAVETRPCKEPLCKLTAWKTTEPGTALAVCGPDAMAWGGYQR